MKNLQKMRHSNCSTHLSWCLLVKIPANVGEHHEETFHLKSFSGILIGPESEHWQCLSMDDWLTHSLPFSRLHWFDPGVWGCYCCWYWWCGSCWQQFVAGLGIDAADVLLRLWSWILIEIVKLTLINMLNFKFSRDADVWLKLVLGWDSEDEIWSWFVFELW